MCGESLQVLDWLLNTAREQNAQLSDEANWFPAGEGNLGQIRAKPSPLDAAMDRLG